MADAAIRIEMTDKQRVALAAFLAAQGITDSYTPLGLAYRAVVLGRPADA